MQIHDEMFDWKKKGNMMKSGIYSLLSTEISDRRGKYKPQWDFCSDIVWIFITVCNSVKGEQHIQNTMCPLCQNPLAKINMRGLNASLNFDHSFFQHQSLVPETTC